MVQQAPPRYMLCHDQLFVCSVLGKGLLPSLDYAAERLIEPGARVVPAAVQVNPLCCTLPPASDTVT